MSTTSTENTEAKREAFGPVGKIVGELDDRLGIAKGGRSLLDKIFPDHWSFMLGEIALYSFVILMATGIFLTPPSSPPRPYSCGLHSSEGSFSQ